METLTESEITDVAPRSKSETYVDEDDGFIERLPDFISGEAAIRWYRRIGQFVESTEFAPTLENALCALLKDNVEKDFNINKNGLKTPYRLEAACMFMEYADCTDDFSHKLTSLDGAMKYLEDLINHTGSREIYADALMFLRDCQFKDIIVRLQDGEYDWTTYCAKYKTILESAIGDLSTIREEASNFDQYRKGKLFEWVFLINAKGMEYERMLDAKQPSEQTIAFEVRRAYTREDCALGTNPDLPSKNFDIAVIQHDRKTGRPATLKRIQLKSFASDDIDQDYDEQIKVIGVDFDRDSPYKNLRTFVKNILDRHSAFITGRDEKGIGNLQANKLVKEAELPFLTK